MDSKKMAAYLVAMTVLGAIVFAALGALVEWREGHEMHVPSEVAVSAADASGGSLATLVAGGRIAAETAATELGKQRRSPAVHALDAAMRAVDVAHHAASGETKKTLEEAAMQIRKARVQIQRGDPDAARDRITKVVDQLRGLSVSGRAPVPRDKLSEYEGALVINARGVRIGEIGDVAPDGSTVTLARGGWRDVLGLFDSEGQRRQIPADGLVYGKHKGIGMTIVALPDLELPSRTR